MSPLELVDDRFEKLATELRAARPVASEDLRGRVRTLAPPPRRQWPELNLRRLVPAAGLVGLAAVVAIAAVLGVVHSSTARHQAASVPSTKSSGASKTLGFPPPVNGSVAHASVPVYGATTRDSLVPAPALGRLQRYDAVLKVRVDNQDDLSRETRDAIRFTQRSGGFVSWSAYSAPGTTGNSELVLRIPVQHVQAAIARFSGYGTLVKQQIVLKDVQQKVDSLTANIAALHKTIAKIEQQLAGSLTPDRRAELQYQLQQDKTRLSALTSQKSATVKRAQLSQVALALFVGQKHAAAAGRFHRTMNDAASVLVREFELLLYALLVAGPLLLIGGAGVLVGRTFRRRADQQLLERT